ncbi:helix-turn-helix domain-containing protein [Lactobacillus mellis]|nr:helix-turn-helix domain-containing protein [Bombilactobacillus mellis]
MGHIARMNDVSRSTVYRIKNRVL